MNQITPLQSVQHVRKRYKTYQLIAIIFAVLTLLAAAAAGVSGFQITRLHLRQADAQPSITPDTVAADALKKESADLKSALTQAQQQLAAEKNRVKSLSAKIQELESRLKKAQEAPKTDQTTLHQPDPAAQPSIGGADPSGSLGPEPVMPNKDASPTSAGENPPLIE